MTKKSQEESVRLFESDFMEFFTHVHPAVVLIVWLPVAAICIWAGFTLRTAGSSWLGPILGVLIGLLLWSPSEYLLHRFVFHYHPKSPRLDRFMFLIHGVHHSSPRDKSRLVMPPVASIPMAAICYGLFYLIGGLGLGLPHAVPPLFAGFILGYVIYDITHYSLHHFSIRSGYFKMVRQHHMHHHFQTPDLRYGVSSPLWDYVFKTNPSKAAEKTG
jgi:sterol desaturase/sphingolipid hydroxylase (fatty acid hydroxylase superfamily)